MQTGRTGSLKSLVPRHFVGVFILILLVAAGLRLWSLPTLPPGPHYDEAANGILAAEIAKGVKMPIFIPSYTGKETLFFYATAATMRILGIGLLALRFTSAVLGILTVLATAWLVYELFADDDPVGAPWLAALTATLVATSFWHVLLSRVGFRAIAQPLFQAVTLAALWRGLRKNDGRWLALGGILCGLTGYTYLAARAFPLPLVISLLVLLIADAGRRGQRLIQFILFGVAAAVIFAPLGLYFLRNPDAFTARMSQVGPGGDWSAALDGIRAALEMLFLRGDPYVRFNLPFRPLFGPIIALLFLVGLIVTVWRFFRPQLTDRSVSLTRTRETLLMVWVPIMLLPTALAVNEIMPSNLRAIGLIPLVFVFPARGLWALLRIILHTVNIPRRSVSGAGHTQSASRITYYAPVMITCALLIATGYATIRTYFGRYVSRTDLYEASDGDLADIANYLNQTDLAGTTVYVGSIHYRHPTLAFVADVYPQIKWLVGAASVVYPSSGEALYLFPRSATPDADWLARYLPDGVPIETPAAPDGAAPFTGYHLIDVPQLSNETLANFGGIVRLMNYQVERAVSGDTADVTVVWQILGPSPYPGLTPFYHLADAWGFRWGQAEPFHYASGDWTVEEVVVDRVQVPIAPGAPPGDYFLEFGLYSQSADARLGITDAAGRFAGTTVPLTLTVARAETPPSLDTLSIRQRLDLEIDDDLALLGANLDTTQARPGEGVLLALYWQGGGESASASPSQRPDYTVHLFLENVDGDAVPIYEGSPVHDTYPTSQWIDEEIIADRYNPRLPLAVADAPPGDYPLTMVVTNPEAEMVLGPVILGTLQLIESHRVFDVPPMGHTQRVTLADQVEFLGYDIDLAGARPGGSVRLALYWRALAEMNTDYTVFTHVLDPGGQVVAQQDNPPVDGTYPTTLWLPGEIVVDHYTISLPPDLPPGDYSAEIGLYVAQNGLRLGDPVVLSTLVTVSP